MHGNESQITTVNPGTSCSDVVPHTVDYFNASGLVTKILTACGGGLTLLICLSYIQQLIYIKRFKHEQIEILRLIALLLGLYPMISVTSLLSIVIPRSYVLNEFVASSYLAIAIHRFYKLIMLYYEGEDNFLNEMKDEKIHLNRPPIACCCFMCPKVNATRRNLARIHWLILQGALIRPILLYIAANLWTEGLYIKGYVSKDTSAVYVMCLNVLSSLVGIYGLMLIYRSSTEHLKHLNIKPKFLCFELTMVFMNLQSIIFSILSSFNLPECDGILSSRIKGNVIHHLLLISESFVISWIARYYYLKSLGEMYNLRTTNIQPQPQIELVTANGIV